MGGLSIWHWMIVLVVVLLLFGTGKVSTLMGDFAKGIKSFKKNMAENEPEDSSMAATAERPSGSIPGPAGSSSAARSAETTHARQS
ncbi:MAG: twin-arginine translocase TatA/TatE family subunit [Acetobacteraceae bacterium]